MNIYEDFHDIGKTLIFNTGMIVDHISSYKLWPLTLGVNEFFMPP